MKRTSDHLEESTEPAVKVEPISTDTKEVSITMEDMKHAVVSLTSLLTMKLSTVKAMKNGSVEHRALVTALNSLRKVAIVENETRKIIHEDLMKWIQDETLDARAKRVAELVAAYPEHKIITVEDASQVNEPAFNYPGKIIYIDADTEIVHMQDQ